MLGGWLYYLLDGMAQGFGRLFLFKKTIKCEGML